jgi:hypothetical protein
VVGLLQRVYRVGMAIALGHVAERSIGGDFDAGAWSVAARLIELGPASRLSVGTLNYDGLLHAGLMDVGRDEWGRPTFMIADLADGRTLRNFEVVPGHSLVGYPIRVVDDFPPDRACLIQMHGSLGWLRSPDDPSQVWRFTLGELRAAGYWRAWRDGRTEWSPVVVLTDRKENATRAWPFALAYDSFLRRLTTADRWLIAGYGMGDTPVNLVFKTATIERRRQGRPPIPPTLIVGYNEPPEGLAARAAERLGLKMDTVAVTAAGVPAALRY